MRSTGAILLLVVVLVVGFAGCAGCGTYNSLVQQDEQVRSTWANVESQYQRRADLIPNIVRTVEGQADFERGTLTEVIEARSRATSIQLSADDLSDPEAIQRFQEAQTALGSSLGRLLVTAEAYPTLQANEGFLRLQDQLEGTENRIATARNDYNQAVAGLNGRIRTFPANLVAGVAGVSARAPFEAQEGSDRAPEVDFGGN